MILTIDSLDGTGARDYTRFLDAENPMRITRKLNQPAEAVVTLVAEATQVIVPSVGGRVIIARADGYKLFTGYLSAAPEFEYLGWTHSGPAYRYSLQALGDEFILDRKVLPRRSAMVARTAGSILRQLTADVAAGVFDVTGVQDLEAIQLLPIDPEESWSAHAAGIALRMRSSYRAHDAKLTLKPLGGVTHTISEADGKVIPEALRIATKALSGNQVLVRGNEEPRE